MKSLEKEDINQAEITDFKPLTPQP